jgi:hypothetical protein
VGVGPLSFSMVSDLGLVHVCGAPSGPQGTTTMPGVFGFARRGSDLFFLF